MNTNFKIGDYVSRRKYNNDIIFKIKEINGDNVILSGVDLRLYADCNINDLVLTSKKNITKRKEMIRNLNTDKYFYIPGTILHLDADEDYLDKCKEYYQEQKVKYNGYIFNEKNFKYKINNLINKHKPNIVVLTGHDAYYKNNKYKNSKYYIETVKEIRNKNSNIIIIAGACQSDYDGLIKSGATFASSPSHINIHALDPAIIASYIALSSKEDSIDLMDILSKTKYGSEGIGGIKINGTMITGYPRKNE